MAEVSGTDVSELVADISRALALIAETVRGIEAGPGEDLGDLVSSGRDALGRAAEVLQGVPTVTVLLEEDAELFRTDNKILTCPPPDGISGDGEL